MEPSNGTPAQLHVVAAESVAANSSTTATAADIF
jgi:hypothetical protein